uniref:Uncharacterized protein n=1 Tax=Oryza barthii TaxID=65489 RepID=A0A0D3GDP2_9ORYZ
MVAVGTLPSLKPWWAGQRRDLSGRVTAVGTISGTDEASRSTSGPFAAKSGKGGTDNATSGSRRRPWWIWGGESNLPRLEWDEIDSAAETAAKYGGNKDWGRREILFELAKSLFYLVRPGKSPSSVEKLEERESPFSEARDDLGSPRLTILRRRSLYVSTLLLGRNA